VLRSGRRDLRIGEQPLQFARACAVEPELRRRRHEGGHEARADRELQVEQQIETPRLEHAAQPQQLAGHCAFLEGDKLDLWKDCRHQPGFEFADDPGESGRRPCLLERAQCGRRVAGVANGR